MIYFTFPEGRREKKLFINKDSLQVQICINLKKGKNGVAQQVTFTAGEDPLKVQYHCQLLTYLIHTYFSLSLSLFISLWNQRRRCRRHRHLATWRSNCTRGSPESPV